MIRAIEDVEQDVIGLVRRPMAIQEIVCELPGDSPARVKVAALNLLYDDRLTLDEQCRFIRYEA